ncbi:hypothetical protein PAPYR_11175 [Paratrimastix pyriformis]|uniref:Uncharacterized protein n=1 Tax=Paratrimastix pyriformis TaxID=342808 RepID=A0ABQ8U6Z0_9EUKA|nr:hypothetical protein PAPYR_11175 [Paratrimastix pyriformis]
MSILLIKFLDVSAVLRACCASVHSFLVWEKDSGELRWDGDLGQAKGSGTTMPVDRTVGEGGNGRVGADMELVVGDGDSGM